MYFMISELSPYLLCKYVDTIPLGTILSCKTVITSLEPSANFLACRESVMVSEYEGEYVHKQHLAMLC